MTIILRTASVQIKTENSQKNGVYKEIRVIVEINIYTIRVQW